jgi:hypothetical protein
MYQKYFLSVNYNCQKAVLIISMGLETAVAFEMG